MRNGRRAIVPAFLLGATYALVLGTPGCKAPPPEGPTLDEAIAAFAATACDRIAECAPTFVDLQFGGDPSACAPREIETIGPLVSLPGVSATPEAMLACRDALVAADCPTILGFLLDNFDGIPACVQAGTLADGTPCVHPFQCASTSCERTEGVSCGTCVPRLSAGSACDSADDCAMGSGCNAGTCTRFGDTGDVCDAGSRCRSALGCVGGLCGPRAVEGDTCTELTDECDFWEAGLVCNPAIYECMPMTFVGASDGCGVSATAAIACGASTCFPSPLNGTCVAFAADGAACDETNGPLCEFHARCVGGVCEALLEPVCE